MSSESELGMIEAKHRRNPPWVRDELILALDLYLDSGVLDSSHPRVIELSEFLKALPLHVDRPDPVKFRNPNGVSLKLANFKALDPRSNGKGMADVSRGDRSVWERYAEDPQSLSELAKEIRRLGASNSADLRVSVENEEAVDEGRLVLRAHLLRERNRGVVQRKKAQAVSSGQGLRCEVCGFDYEATYGSRGTGFIEVHHVIPLAQVGEARTRLSDLALVCANCHRMIHRKSPWLTIDELQSLVSSSGHDSVDCGTRGRRSTDDNSNC